jgi:oligopeptidase B
MLMLATITLSVSLLAWSPPPTPVASISASVPVRIDPGIVRPPVAKKITTERMIHSERRLDDYGWLREKSDPEVISYIRAENDYTAAVMRPTLAFQATLYQEILAHLRRTEISPPMQEEATGITSGWKRGNSIRSSVAGAAASMGPSRSSWI